MLSAEMGPTATWSLAKTFQSSTGLSGGWHYTMGTLAENLSCFRGRPQRTGVLRLSLHHAVSGQAEELQSLLGTGRGRKGVFQALGHPQASDLPGHLQMERVCVQDCQGGPGLNLFGPRS